MKAAPCATISASPAPSAATGAARQAADPARLVHPVWSDASGSGRDRLDLGEEIRTGEARDDHQGRRRRSDEHTSELQSLMRTSYDVVCLKTQKEQPHPT